MKQKLLMIVALCFVTACQNYAENEAKSKAAAAAAPSIYMAEVQPLVSVCTSFIESGDDTYFASLARLGFKDRGRFMQQRYLKVPENPAYKNYLGSIGFFTTKSGCHIDLNNFHQNDGAMDFLAKEVLKLGYKPAFPSRFGLRFVKNNKLIELRILGGSFGTKFLMIDAKK